METELTKKQEAGQKIPEYVFEFIDAILANDIKTAMRIAAEEIGQGEQISMF